MPTSTPSDFPDSGIYIKETYNDAELRADMNRIHTDLDIENLNGGYSDGVITKSATQFNRFKMAFPDEELTKTFAYVFFTRPDLYLLHDVIVKTTNKIRVIKLNFFIYFLSPTILNF